MTTEELLEFKYADEAHKAELAKIDILRTSTNMEDRITGILMDVELGEVGFWEQYAREKAKEIIKECEQYYVKTSPNSN